MGVVFTGCTPTRAMAFFTSRPRKSNTTRPSMSASTVWHDGFAKLGFPAALNQQAGWKISVNGKPFAGPVTSPLHTEVPLASHDVVTFGVWFAQSTSRYALCPSPECNAVTAMIVLYEETERDAAPGGR